MPALKVKSILLVTAIAATALAAQCFSVTDPMTVSVNVKNITGTYNLPAGLTSFQPGCLTINSEVYLERAYRVVRSARLVDVTLQTVGSFDGNVVNGAITVNGKKIVSYSGGWNAFNEPTSLLLQSSPLTRHTEGITALLDAINRKAPVTVCHTGSFSTATPAGLKLVGKVFAQVDAAP